MPVRTVCSALLSALLLASVSPAQTPVTFFQPTSLGDCYAVAAADFNGDGNLDVACAGDTLTIWLGDGHGHFHQTNQVLPYEQVQVVTGDFNGDGRPDLAIAGSGQVILLPGRGDGTFGTQIVIANLTSVALAAADLNQDGRLDLLVGVADANPPSAVEVFLGNGNGTFQKPIVTGVTTALSVNIAVADFNGDGIPDIASADNDELEVVLGDGDGTFGPPIVTAIGISNQPFAIADFTGDGILDVALSYSSKIYVYQGNGDGSFSPGPVTSGAVGAALLAADLNGDGRPDLVMAGVGIALNRDGGAFEPAEWYQDLDLAAGVAGDFRNLGRPDLMVAGGFYPNDGTGHFHAPRSFPITSCGGGCHLIAGDFDNDGNLDAAAVANDTVRVYTGTGGGNFNDFRQSSFSLPDRELTNAATAADFNSDGNLDLAVGSGNYVKVEGQVALLPGNGDGTFGRPAVVYTGYPVYGLVTADFKLDGHAGLAIGTKAGLVVMCGNGAGGFTTTAAIQGIANTSSVATADFNQDGTPDLATASDVYLGNGDGTFRHAYTLAQAASLVQTGDFNGDGIPDLVTSDGYNIIVWPGIGDGTFGLPIAVTTNLSESVFLVADLNGDGISDIAVTATNNISSSLLLYLGSTDGNFRPENVANVPPFGDAPISSGDFNNKGRTDLLFVSLFNQIMTLTNATQ
jgi:VCBS repeat protein